MQNKEEKVVGIETVNYTNKKTGKEATFKIVHTISPLENAKGLKTNTHAIFGDIFLQGVSDVEELYEKKVNVRSTYSNGREFVVGIKVIE